MSALVAFSSIAVNPVWCACGPDGLHLGGYGPVCVESDSSWAAPQPLVTAPRAALVASTHRTASTTFHFPGRTDRPIATPLGTTSRFFSPI